MGPGRSVKEREFHHGLVVALGQDLGGKNLHCLDCGDMYLGEVLGKDLSHIGKVVVLTEKLVLGCEVWQNGQDLRLPF